MRFSRIAFILLVVAPLSFAQLLPQKQAEDLPKIDRAMIFKVDYSDKAEASDSSSRKINPSIKEQEKGNYLKNSLIWTGLCVTGAPHLVRPKFTSKVLEIYLRTNVESFESPHCFT